MSLLSQVARAAGDEVRPPGSPAERAAAQRLAAWLRARGDAAEVRPRRARPATLAAAGVGAGIAAAGSLLSVVSAPAGLACAALGALVVALEPGPAREVTDVYVAPEDVGRALVVCAAFGSPRLGLGRVPRWWLLGAAVAVVAACAARVAGVSGLWLGVLQLLPTIVLLAAVAAAIDAGLAGWGPGERAAAAVAVAVHDELAGRPPASLSPALLLYGATRPRLEAAVVLEIRPGAGVTARDPAVQRATDALGRPAPRRGGRRGHVAVGAAGDEAAVDLALAIADALDQAGGIALRFAGHSRRLDA